ncbi:DUF2927 domain-containing protein [Paracoccus salsus]|uniref:DUF2927 domain-containing protein n=1 Tax=Paracoccus salsus TaxID=2911061 RepID=UPI001F16C3B2|nr:DUF2927 domain-containing protein [Paracoccus salsus]MCF3972927.1 DUF2927 domain-containing protein [Paracoccus salsus]
MIPARLHRPAWLGLALFLAGCAGNTTIAPVPPLPRPAMPAAQPDGPSQAELRKARAERNQAVNATAAVVQASASATSETRRAQYASAERDLLAQGRLRRDRVPMDAPIDAALLVRNFIEIALRDEYSRQGDRLVADARDAPLRRWTDAVSIQLEFGPSADTALRRAYRAEVASFAGRLTRATGHPVGLTGSDGNFLVLVLNEDERRNILPLLERLVPELPQQDRIALRDLDPQNYCAVFAYSRGHSSAYVRAVALMRAELPSLLRSSCIHEELAQGMGLANDSPAARPSIFNDDEEFALLTRHDELLLKILYDPRLRPGMTQGEARPIVRKIVAELLG